MQTPNPDSPHLPLGDTLKTLLETDDPSGLSIGHVTRAVGEKSFGLTLIILSLPSALPFPAPGYSTPFGLVIILIAAQMIVGRSSLWLPARLARIRIRPKLAHTMLGSASKFLKKIERFIRPRQLWIWGYFGQTMLAILVIGMASLMILPIPLTNTFPAVVIFMVGIGLSEEDGLLTIGAFAVGCLAALLYTGIIYLVATQGIGVIEPIKDWIKAALRMD